MRYCSDIVTFSFKLNPSNFIVCILSLKIGLIFSGSLNEKTNKTLDKSIFIPVKYLS